MDEGGLVLDHMTRVMRIQKTFRVLFSRKNMPLFRLKYQSVADICTKLLFITA